MATLSASPPPASSSASSSGLGHRRTATVTSPTATSKKSDSRAFQNAIDRVSATQSSLSSLTTLRSQLTQILPTIRAVVRASGSLDAQRTVVKSLREAALDEELRINAEEASPNLQKFLEDWVSWNEAYQTWKSAAQPSLPSRFASTQSLNGTVYPGAGPSTAPAPVVSADVLSGGPRANSPPPAAAATGQPAASDAAATGSQDKPEGSKVIPLPADVAVQLQRYRRDPDHPDLPPLLGLDECMELRRLMGITKLLRFSSVPHERGGRGMVTESQSAVWPVRFFFIFDEQEGVVWKCSLTAELIVDEKAKRPRPISIIDRSEEKLHVPACLFRQNLVQAGRWVQAATLTQDAFLLYLLYCVTGGNEAVASGLLRYLRTRQPPTPPRVS